MATTPWQIVQNSRRLDRIQCKDLIDNIFDGIIELKGDRIYSDDSAVFTALAYFKGIPVSIVGFRKGISLDQRIKFNSAMAQPSGYNKALRAYKQAEKFHRPIINFIDTPGAYPGMAAEENCQAQSIASCIYNLSNIKTKVISIIVSEACSGGALAMCVCDKLYMLENAYFSILSPEGYASILWKNNDYEEAAKKMKITSKDLADMRIIDGIINEGAGIYHQTNKILEREIIENMDVFPDRYEKIRNIDAIIRRI